MKKAGLNVGMMYKGGGTGGTTGSISGMSGQNAGTPNIDIATAMQTQADIELKKAQARNLNVDSDNKESVGRDSIVADTDYKKALTATEEGKQILQNIEYKQKSLEYDFNVENFDNAIQQAKNETKLQEKEIYIKENQGKITKEEANASRTYWTLNLNGMALDNILKKSQNELIKANTAKIKEETSIIFKDYLARAKNASTNERNQLMTQAIEQAKLKLQEQGLNLQEQKMYMDGMLKALNIGASVLGGGVEETTIENYDGTDKSYHKKTTKTK